MIFLVIAIAVVYLIYLALTHKSGDSKDKHRAGNNFGNHSAYLTSTLPLTAATNVATSVLNMTPIQYENMCGGELTKLGWKVTFTPTSGDNGADVIATRGPNTLVLQCKLYSSPVGNRAVQEVYSAKAYYGANKAVVVTNAGYTRSAIDTARKLGVMLVHHSDLRDI